MILPDKGVGLDTLPSFSHQNIMVRGSDVDRRQHQGDRRLYIRYTVDSGLFVILRKPMWYKLWRSRKVAVPIIDISLKGVSIESTPVNRWLYHTDTLSIVTANKKTKVDNILYKLVSTRQVISVPGNGNSNRVGIKFANLSINQKWQLSFLLEEATLHPIPDALN
jgi:hypothetical protein